MSKLEELIARLCPDGVEYKSISDLADTFIGLATSVTKYKSDDGVLLLHNSDIKDGKIELKKIEYITEEFAKKNSKKILRTNDVITVHTGDVGTSAVVTEEYNGSIGFTTITSRIKNLREISPEYLCKYLNSGHFKSAIYSKTISDRSNLNLDSFDKIKLPVPPLEVQREIVHILDSFTLLTAELAAELAARQKQYEFYRDKLLTFDNVRGGETSSVPWKRLDELFPFIRNGFVGTIKNHFTNKENGVRYLEGTNIHDGVISDNEILYVTKEFHEKHKKNELKPDDILMVQSGHIGECAIVGEKYAGANCHALIIMSNGGNCISKFYVHYFHTLKGFKSLNPAITGGTIKHVLAGKMGKILVPVPPLAEQQRIVDILDRFDVLCNDITSGLPAEIEARKKQYEYYRDKLLTFKELKKEA